MPLLGDGSITPYVHEPRPEASSSLIEIAFLFLHRRVWPSCRPRCIAAVFRFATESPSTNGGNAADSAPPQSARWGATPTSWRTTSTSWVKTGLGMVLDKTGSFFLAWVDPQLNGTLDPVENEVGRCRSASNFGRAGSSRSPDYPDIGL